MARPAIRFIARDRIKALNPDVVTLDVEMPNMDGVTFLRKIMALRPMPVVMISTLTQAGAETTLEALEIGAVDFIAKPTHDVANGLAEIANELQSKIKQAARARVPCASPCPHAAADRRQPRRDGRTGAGNTDQIIAIGASTGGVEALEDSAYGLAGGLSADRDYPTYAATFHRRFCRTAQPGMPDGGVGGGASRHRSNPIMSISPPARIIWNSSASAAITVAA